MAVDRSTDLMKALVAKLYRTVTGSDANVKLPRNKFVSWVTPGIPFKNEDFTFCQKGLVGDTAEETRALQHQAWTLAKLFDYVPEVGVGKGFIDKPMQTTIYASTQDTISKVYGDVLKFSKVLNNQLSDEEKAKLKELRGLLTVTEKNLMGKEVTKESPLVIAYNEGLSKYLDAVDEYMNLLIDAQSAKGSDPEAIRRVQNFSNKSKSYIKRMQAAEMAWNTTGYKNDYEEIAAYIAQVTEKSLVLYKEALKQTYANGLLTSAQEGTAGDFYYTTLLPGNFAESAGWTTFTWYQGDYAEHADKSTSQWGGEAGVSFGLFSFGAKAGGSRTEENSNKSQSNFRASFEFTQIPICRPWFDPGFFTMRAWTLDDAWNLNFDKTVSDGSEVPVGRLVAYPVTALFVRNLRFTLDESSEQARFIKSEIEAGGHVGWGPFSIGGSYKHGSESRDSSTHREGGEIVIPEIQLIATINNVFGKVPNTNPAIKPEQFVGGASVIEEGGANKPDNPPKPGT